MSIDAESILMVGADTTPLESSLRRAESSMDSMMGKSREVIGSNSDLSVSFRSLAPAIIAGFGGAKVVQFLTKSMSAAAMYREDVAQFEHVFRNVRGESEKLLSTLTGDAFGRSRREAMQMTMGLGSLLKGIGMTDQAAVSLSSQFAQLSIDIGSFMAKDSSEVMSAIQSGLMGNTQALRTYGVFLTETSLKERIAARAKEGHIYASEREARVYAVLEEIYRQQSDALGDFAVESQNYRNQLTQFWVGVEELQVSVGEAFLESAAGMIRTLNSTVKWLNEVDPLTKKAIIVIGGLTAGLVGMGKAWQIISPLVAQYATKSAAGTSATTAMTAAQADQATATTTATGSITAQTSAIEANTAAKERNSAASLGAGIGPANTASAATSTGLLPTTAGTSKASAFAAAKAGEQKNVINGLRKDVAKIDKHVMEATAARDKAALDQTASQSRIAKLTQVRTVAEAERYKLGITNFAANSPEQKRYYDLIRKRNLADSLIVAENKKLAESTAKLNRVQNQLSGITANRNQAQVSLLDAEKKLERLQKAQVPAAKSGFAAFSKRATERAAAQAAVDTQFSNISKDFAARQAAQQALQNRSWAGAGMAGMANARMMAGTAATGARRMAMTTGTGLKAGAVATGAALKGSVVMTAGILASMAKLAVGVAAFGAAIIAVTGIIKKFYTSYRDADEEQGFWSRLTTGRFTFDKIDPNIKGVDRAADNMTAAMSKCTLGAFDMAVGFYEAIGLMDMAVEAIGHWREDFAAIRAEEKASKARAEAVAARRALEIALPGMIEEQQKALGVSLQAGALADEERAMIRMTDGERNAIYERRLKESETETSEIDKELEETRKAIRDQAEVYRKAQERSELIALAMQIKDEKANNDALVSLGYEATDAGYRKFMSNGRAASMSLAASYASNKAGQDQIALMEKEANLIEKRVELIQASTDLEKKVYDFEVGMKKDNEERLKAGMRHARDMEDTLFSFTLGNVSTNSERRSMLEGRFDKSILEYDSATNEEARLEALRRIQEAYGALGQLQDQSAPSMLTGESRSNQAIYAGSVQAQETVARAWTVKQERFQSVMEKHVKEMERVLKNQLELAKKQVDEAPKELHARAR